MGWDIHQVKTEGRRRLAIFHFIMSEHTHSLQVSPYRRLASIYDHVMRHVDYVHWASYVESLFGRHHVSPVDVLDLACGTGSLAIELHRRGYHMQGADACREMLDVGEEKAKQLGYAIAFYHRDLRDLCGLPACDAVLCLYDSMNYMMTLDDMAEAFAQMYRVVKPGGICAFDVCTESNSIQHFNDLREEDSGNGFTYVRHSYFEDGVQYNRFDIHFEDTDEMVEEIHRQRIYPLKAVEEVLETSEFEVECAYGGFGYAKPTEMSDRVHFVLRG